MVFCFSDEEAPTFFLLKLSTCMIHELYLTSLNMSLTSWKMATTMITPQYSCSVLYHCSQFFTLSVSTLCRVTWSYSHYRRIYFSTPLMLDLAKYFGQWHLSVQAANRRFNMLVKLDLFSCISAMAMKYWSKNDRRYVDKTTVQPSG